MVIIGQMANTEVRIAALKSRLSAYLRYARLGGEVIVKDRETPIARLVPYEASPGRLPTRRPTVSLKDIDRLLDKPGPKPKLRPAIFKRLVRETKQDWFDKWLHAKPTSTRR